MMYQSQTTADMFKIIKNIEYLILKILLYVPS